MCLLRFAPVRWHQHTGYNAGQQGSSVMKLYTKTGDSGETGLIGGQRVSKDHVRVRAYGDVDEANAVLGCALAAKPNESTAGMLREIQADLFSLGAALASPPGRSAPVSAQAGDVARLESWIDEVDARQPPLTNFVLPGGSPAAAWLHLARCVCRRAERSVVALAQESDVDATVLKYLNRLSDLLFAMARDENRSAGVDDVVWNPRGDDAGRETG